MKGGPQTQSQPPTRNDPCPCGSGRKYKHCCSEKDRASAAQIDFADAHYRRGVALEAHGRIDEAIEAYRVAAACGSAPEALSRLGRLFSRRGLVAEASVAFRASAASGDGTDQRLSRVRALMIEGKNPEAAAEARRAVTLDPRSGYGFWLLGRILAEAGRFTEAREALERSTQLERKLGGAYYDLVRTYKLTETDRPLIDRMLKVVPALTGPDSRIRLHLALGKAFDDLGEFGRAIGHCDEASRIKQEAFGAFDRNAFAREIDNLINRFTTEFLAAHAARGDNSEQPIMVLGMPRSGTTLVEQILSCHDQISGGGEMQFWGLRGPLFDRSKSDASIAEFQRTAAEDGLSALQAIAPGAARVTDKNPFNFLWAGVIHLTFPCALIIHCRRNPIDTCLSIFMTYFRPRDDFTTAREDLVFYYRQYLRLMAHWRATLPAPRLVEVDYEALIADPEGTSRRLIGACGLEWQSQCLRPQENARVVRSASRWQARQPIHSGAIGRWRRYEPWLGAFRELEADALETSSPGLSAVARGSAISLA